MIMFDVEKKLGVLDFVVLLGLVIIGCLSGKIAMNNVSNTIVGFNVPAIMILVVGELIWLKAKAKLQERWNKQEGQKKQYE